MGWECSGLVLFLIILNKEVCAQESKTLHDAPFELPYFKIETGSFNSKLKYPPYRHCILPEKLAKKQINFNSSPAVRTWRLYWNKLVWDAYFLEDGDEISNWELEKENADLNITYWGHALLGVITWACWIILLALISLLLIPLTSMLIFRALFISWRFLINKWLISLLRWMVIKRAKLRRLQQLQVFKDAGRKPPPLSFSLPKLLRKTHDEVVPKEMEEPPAEAELPDPNISIDGSISIIPPTAAAEEGDEEGEDEHYFIIRQGKKDKGHEHHYSPCKTPEFTPEYPAVKEDVQELSDAMFKYLIKVKYYGMYAVWTRGVEDVDIDEIVESHKKGIVTVTEAL